MAKPQSEAKRDAILHHATRLFAERGYAGTSVAAIARRARLPVGSIYTYFANKEELLRAIIDEGWNELWHRLQRSVEEQESPEAKLQVLIDRFLPEMVADSDLVTILITEAVGKTDLRGKIDAIVGLLESILAPLRAQNPAITGLDRKELEGALLVYFLGTLNAVKLSHAGSLGVSLDHILSFLRLTVTGTLALQKKP
jgi:AcrR family transcriptional regulator